MRITKLSRLSELCRACCIKENGPYPFGLPRTPITCDHCGAESDTAYYLERKATA